jgi:hypothetical protein
MPVPRCFALSSAALAPTATDPDPPRRRPPSSGSHAFPKFALRPDRHHFFLDCLTTEEVESLAAKLRAIVSPSGLWLVSEFAIPAGWFGRLVAAPLVSGLYLAFAWLTGLSVRSLPDHRSALRAAGFALQQRRAWLGGLLVSELWSASSPHSSGKHTPRPQDRRISDCGMILS